MVCFHHSVHSRAGADVFAGKIFPRAKRFTEALILRKKSTHAGDGSYFIIPSTPYIDYRLDDHVRQTRPSYI